MEERRIEHIIGATELRQKLTDVLQDVRDQGRTYVIQTVGRPQAAIVNLEEFRRFKRFAEQRREYIDRPKEMADPNARRSMGLSEEEVLELVERSRKDVVGEADQR